jgi:hypothetical protein
MAELNNDIDWQDSNFANTNSYIAPALNAAVTLFSGSSSPSGRKKMVIVVTDGVTDYSSVQKQAERLQNLFVLLTPIWVVMCASARARRGQSINERRSRFDRFSALIEVIRGDRTLIGLSEWMDEMPAGIAPALYWKSLAAPVGLIEIDAGIVPDEADPGTKLRARVYYMYEKNVYLDLVLVLRCLGRRLGKYFRKRDKLCRGDAPQYMRVVS